MGQTIIQNTNKKTGILQRAPNPTQSYILLVTILRFLVYLMIESSLNVCKILYMSVCVRYAT